MQIKAWAIAATTTFALGACGETITDQAVLGGAVGAGAAAVTSGSLLQGAAIGAAGNLLYCQTQPSKCN